MKPTVGGMVLDPVELAGTLDTLAEWLQLVGHGGIGWKPGLNFGYHWRVRTIDLE